MILKKKIKKKFIIIKDNIFFLIFIKYLTQGIKNNIWKTIGFQNADPRSDFRGGGLISLKNLIYFGEKEGFNKIVEYSENDSDFLFACTSINVTFHLKKYFHLADFLEFEKDKEVFFYFSLF